MEWHGLVVAYSWAFGYGRLSPHAGTEAAALLGLTLERITDLYPITADQKIMNVDSN